MAMMNKNIARMHSQVCFKWMDEIILWKDRNDLLRFYEPKEEESWIILKNIPKLPKRIASKRVTWDGHGFELWILNKHCTFVVVCFDNENTIVGWLRVDHFYKSQQQIKSVRIWQDVSLVKQIKLTDWWWILTILINEWLRSKIRFDRCIGKFATIFVKELFLGIINYCIYRYSTDRAEREAPSQYCCP